MLPLIGADGVGAFGRPISIGGTIVGRLVALPFRTRWLSAGGLLRRSLGLSRRSTAQHTMYTRGDA
jgi:hypothetical protein